MPDWLVTMTTRYPASFSRRIASAAPGTSVTFSGSCRNPGSSTMVPSRSRKTARLTTQRRDHSLDLLGKDRAGVEQYPAARDARDDRRIVGAQPFRERFVGKSREPGPQFGAGERAAADLRISLDQLAAEPLGAGPDALLVLGQHAQHGDFANGDLRIAIERERRLEPRQGELVGAHRARDGIGTARGNRRLAAHENAGLRPAEQLVAAEGDQIGAGGDRFLNGRFTAQSPARKIHQ